MCVSMCAYTANVWVPNTALDFILTSDMMGRGFEVEINLDVSYNCLTSYVQYPDTGKSEKYSYE